MQNKKRLLTLMALLALIQLAIPALMIYEENKVINEGQVFRFKTAPIDPSDPFRGKYIILNFTANNFILADSADFNQQEIIYVSITNDDSGFAKISSVSEDIPSGDDYIKASVSYVARYDSVPVVYIDYPFNRYYMNEEKAKGAENAYAKERESYAEVRVLKGRALIEGVVIGGKRAEDIEQRNTDYLD